MSQLAPFSSYSTETVCRCCLAEECSKDIFNEYFWMGKREVYSEMLFEAFNVAIEHSSSKDLNSIGHLICEPCISKLRDASDFKKQVVRSDKALRERINCRNNAAFNEPVKLEIKSELKEIDNYNEYHDLFNEEDDHPLKRVKKNCQKIKIDNLEITKKKSKGIKIRPKKAKLSINTDTCDSGIQDQKDGEWKDLVGKNAAIILKHSTAYPFQQTGQYFRCCICRENFEDPCLFRKHMDDIHEDFDKSATVKHYNDSLTRVDITNLRCKICQKPFEDLDCLARHLKEHDLVLDLTCCLGLVPFKLEINKYVCFICSKIFSNMKQLCRHTGLHYSRNICDTCGSNFETLRGLKYHVKFSHSIGFLCRTCKQPFPTSAAKKKHLDINKKCLGFSCRFCGERFRNSNFRQEHLEKVHGTPKLSFPCSECEQVFDKRMSRYLHFKLTHTDDNKCEFCELRFSTKRALEEHICRLHTGDKPHECSICDKGFTTVKGLKRHQVIHDDSKRAACNVCTRLFDTKTRLKQHLQKYHPESYAKEFPDKS